MKTHLKIFSFAKVSILISLFLVGSLPVPAAAYDIDFFQGNDILYYNPEAIGNQCADTSASTDTGSTLPSLVGNDNAEKIWNFLTTGERGLTAEQAAGVMGNLQQESGYDPTLVESNGVGYGIVQWSYERRSALESAASQQGVAVSDLGFQLEYMYQEAQDPPLINFNNLFSNFGVSASDNVWNPLKKQTSVERATTFWHDSFERSGDYVNYGGIQRRIDYANQAYNSFKDKMPAGGNTTSNGSSGGSCSSSSFNGGGLTQTLLAYAWPDYTDGQYPLNPEPKPAYLAAATKAESEGKWVGGGRAEIGVPGIDCGAFVSLLLINSGYEPNYNYGLDSAKAGNQVTQLAWAKQNWKFLGNGGSINVADLKPGDVAYRDGHTFVFVGQVNGFNSQYASTSYSYTGRSPGTYSSGGVTWRVPMAGGSYENATDPTYEWYGKR